jgi:hypothetical protein
VARPREPESASSPKTPDHRRGVGFTIGYIATFLLGLWLLQLFVANPFGVPAREIPYSDFRAKLKGGELVDVTLGSPQITGHMKNAAAASERDRIVSFRTVAPPSDPKLLDDLETAGVKYEATPPAGSVGSLLLSFVLPMLFLGAFWYAAYRRRRARPRSVRPGAPGGPGHCVHR